LMGSQLLCVTDANIWLDLLAGSLLAVVARLSFRCVIPDVLMHEDLKEATQQQLRALGVREVEATAEQVKEAVRLVKVYPQASPTDLLALVIARWQEATLLTGDRALRKAAEKERVEVHGTIWLIEQLIAEEAISATEAADALEQMRSQGRWLPVNEVERRLREWRAA